MIVNLGDLAEVGLQALEALEAGRTVPLALAGQARQVIGRARQSYGRAELMVVDPVDRLVKKAAGQ
jgi:hypothetical protein